MTSAHAPPLGAHTFIWTPVWDPNGARLAAHQAAAAGYSIIEIPLLDPAGIDVVDTVRVLDDAALTCTCSLGLPPDCHLPDAPDEALSFLRTAISVAEGLGSRWVTGALYGNLGTLTGAPPTHHELETIARTVHSAAVFAAQRNVNLGLEIINRYETYLLNTVDQAIGLLDRIDAPNVYIHLDTYHMNIEQPSFSQEIHRLGDRLGYVHLAESHRGTIGDGHIPFPDILSALAAVNYAGPLVVEAFLNAPPAIRTATATWTTHDLSAQEFATTSLAHFTHLLEESFGSVGRAGV